MVTNSQVLLSLFEEAKSRRIVLNREEFATALGYSRPHMYRLMANKAEVPDELLEKAKDLLNDSSSVSRQTLNEPDHSYQKKRLELKNGADKRVPVYGGYTTLGNIEVLDDDNMKHRVVAELPGEIFPGCNYSEKAKGDSMYPLIMNQALLVGKICPVAGITFGEKYIIKTKTGMDTTKFIHPGEKGKLKLKAYNKSIPDQEIDIKDVIFCCRVHWIINPT